MGRRCNRRERSRRACARPGTRPSSPVAACAICCWARIPRTSTSPPARPLIRSSLCSRGPYRWARTSASSWWSRRSTAHASILKWQRSGTMVSISTGGGRMQCASRPTRAKMYCGATSRSTACCSIRRESRTRRWMKASCWTSSADVTICVRDWSGPSARPSSALPKTSCACCAGCDLRRGWALLSSRTRWRRYGIMRRRSRRSPASASARSLREC